MMMAAVNSTHKNTSLLMAVYRSSVPLGEVVDDICKPDSAYLSKVVDDAGCVLHQTVANHEVEETQNSKA